MYPQYGEPRYPPGHDYGQGQVHMPLDRAGGMGRYPYSGYYGPKGSEGSQYGDAANAPRNVGPPYGSKTGNVGSGESVYGPGWNSIGYMGPNSKSSMASPYSMQADMYGAGMGPNQTSAGYPDSLPPNPLGMSGYPGGSSGYPAPPNPYLPGGGQQYPPYHRPGIPPSHVGMMHSSRSTHPPASPGVASEGEGGFSGSVPPYPHGAGGQSRTSGSLASSRAWSNQDLTHGGSWPQGYPHSGPTTPTQHSQQGKSPMSQQPKSQTTNQQQGTQGSQVYRQTSQQSFGAMSPQAPYSNKGQQQLTKQSSISSIRDALMATTPSSTSTQQQPMYSSPVMSGEQQLGSPMTPSANTSTTPDGTPSVHHPIAGNVLSPSANALSRQDSQLSSSLGESLSRQNSELKAVRPGAGDHHSNAAATSGSDSQDEGHQIDRELNSIQSPTTPVVSLVGSGGEMVNTRQDGIRGDLGRPDNLILAARSPSIHGNQLSPSLAIHGKGSESKTPVMSPITRNHSSILNQYNYSDEQQRKDFLDSLFTYLEKEGISLSRPPMVCKAPLDLYRVYNSVQHYGGFLNVTEKRLWREVIKSSVSTSANPNSGSARTLQQYYTKFLLPYECHLTNVDFSLCLSKIEYSVSRHTSISSPGSQLSSDGEFKERVVNHLPDSLDNDTNDAQVNGNGSHVSDKEIESVSDRLAHRVDSSGSSVDNTLVTNGQDTRSSTDSSGPPLKATEPMSTPALEQPPRNHAKNSENSVDSFPQEMMDPLPEMSVQDAESVLGMSPSPYPNQQPPGGPATPSANQSAPSPSHYSSHFPPTLPPTGSAQPSLEMNEMGSPVVAGTPSNPPSYPPSYPAETTPSPYRLSSRSSIPPGYPSHYSGSGSSPLPHYEGPPDMHYGMGQPPYMPTPYPTTGSPYPPPIPGQRSMEYPSHYGPEHMMSQQTAMGMSDIPPYPGSHGMHPDWLWQQRSRMLSPLPAHLQSQSLHQRYLQQQSMLHQQHALSSMHQHQQQHRTASNSRSRTGPHSSAEAVKIQWQEQNRGIRPTAAHAPEQHEKNRGSIKSSPRPELAPHNKGFPSKLQEQSDSLKSKLPDWSNCVEGTRPHLARRRNLFSGDCGHVEPWRVMMSLKSGLLAESTWALDTLNILLHDDRTVGFFYLKHHHSLLNTLVDHFKMTLTSIFDLEFNDTPMYQPGYEGDVKTKPPPDCENEDDGAGGNTKALLSEATTTDFDVESALVSNESKHEVSDQSETIQQSLIPVANVYDPHQMKLGKSDDLAHVQIPSVNTELFFPEPEIDLSILPQSKRKKLEDSSKLQRVDQTPVHLLLKREVVMSQIPFQRFGRVIRSPRGRERNFLEGMRRRESLGRADFEGSTASSSKDTASNAADVRKDSRVSPSHNHAMRTKSDNVLSSPGRPPKHPLPTLKEEYEVHQKERHPLWNVSPSRESLQSRCLCISNVLRSLSFIPGNDYEFSQHAGILTVLGQLLMLHHDHLIHAERKPLSLRQSTSQEETSKPPQEKIGVKPEEKQFPPRDDYWWWDCLHGLRENTLVILSNISGQLDLSIFPELISYPIMDGLLHWAVCPSSIATDPLPDTALVSSLSPQRLVLETMAKMSISEVNVDFILATPPLTRTDMLFSRLGQFISEKRYPVVRQFALVLLSNLAQGNEASSRQIGQQKMIVTLLLQCLEMAEHTACISGGKLVGGFNPDDPNSLSVAMLRRAATTLHCLSKIPANRTILLCHRDRVLYLCTSQYVEHSVSSILMDVLFELAKL